MNWLKMPKFLVFNWLIFVLNPTPYTLYGTLAGTWIHAPPEIDSQHAEAPYEVAWGEGKGGGGKGWRGTGVGRVEGGGDDKVSLAGKAINVKTFVEKPTESELEVV
jgi:hypothetical protein